MNFRFRSHILSNFASKLKIVKDDPKSEQNSGQASDRKHNGLMSLSGSRVISKGKGQSKEEDSLLSQLYLQSLLEKMEPRDQRIIIPYSQPMDIVENKREIDEWLGEMSFAVASATFNMFVTKQLTYDEVKIYFSENLLLNILLFMENVKDAQVYDVMKYFNVKLQDNLEYLKKKYPQAKEVKPNKKLREAVIAINNMSNDDNDMLAKVQYEPPVPASKKKPTQKVIESTQVEGEKRKRSVMEEGASVKKGLHSRMEPQSTAEEPTPFQETAIKEEDENEEKVEAKPEVKPNPINFVKNSLEDYTPDIMRLINYMISLPSKSFGVKEDKLTYFGRFFVVMQNIFDSVYFPFNYVSEEEVYAFIIQNTNESLEEYLVGKKKGGYNEKAVKEHQEKMKKYTSYKISQKINPNTETYTESEINSGFFEVKSTAVLRVLTKWIEELQTKIKNAREQILYRSFRFKTNEGLKEEQIKLSQNEKYDLYQSALSKQALVKNQEQKMKIQCTQIEGMLAKIGTETDSRNANIPKSQFCVGKFCTQLGSAASVYLVNYLNKLIHYLLQIPEEAGNGASKARGVSLITFKISDLLRCKCSSKQNQILRILNLIKKVDERQPDLFKIVKIKDRLDMGTKDILINILFMKKILCEIQLEINDEVDEKQKVYDSFNHYIYEHTRSILGPIMESACNWTHLDQRAKEIQKYINKSNVQRQTNAKHVCENPGMEPYKFSFVCSNCRVFYSNPTGIIRNLKCKGCQFYKCSFCNERQLSPEKLSEQLEMGKLDPFVDQFSPWSAEKNYLPRFAIFIPKKSKKINYVFVEKVELLEKIYYLKTVENPNNEVEIVIIKELQGEVKAGVKEIADNYFVFEWKERRGVVSIKQSSASKIIIKMNDYQREKEREFRRKINEQKLKQLRKEREKEFKALWGGKRGEDPKEKEKQKEKEKEKENENEIALMEANKEQFLTGENEVIKYSDINEIVENNKRNDTTIYNETLARVSYRNDYRMCYKRVNGRDHILVMSYIPSNDSLASMLKEVLNLATIEGLLENKKEVLMLENERINEDIIDEVLSGSKLNNVFSNVFYIYLDENRIKNLDFLSFFENLKVFHANNNEIETMDGLEDLRCLEEVMMNNNKISLISGVAKKKNLLSLSLDCNCLDRISGLAQLRKLEKLSLSRNEINYVDNPEQLHDLVSLISLDLSFNALEAIEDFGESRHLEYLNLSANNIVEITNLEKLENLMALNLSNNNIEQIKGLEGNCRLEVLAMEGNKIGRIEQLGHLVGLRELNLANNRIMKMENLDQLANLRMLNLNSNKISKLEGTQQLASLEMINLGLNRLRDIPYGQFMEQTQTKKHLRTINLINNPLNTKSEKNLQNLARLVQDLPGVALLTCRLP